MKRERRGGRELARVGGRGSKLAQGMQEMYLPSSQDQSCTFVTGAEGGRKSISNCFIHIGGEGLFGRTTIA